MCKLCPAQTRLCTRACSNCDSIPQIVCVFDSHTPVLTFVFAYSASVHEVDIIFNGVESLGYRKVHIDLLNSFGVQLTIHIHTSVYLEGIPATFLLPRYSLPTSIYMNLEILGAPPRCIPKTKNEH